MLQNTNQSIANSIDGCSENIADLFASKYEKLYNSVKDEKELTYLSDKIDNSINDKDLPEINRVTADVVTDAIGHLKNGKNDPTLKFGSDMLKAAPAIFSTLLSKVFKTFLIHGYVSSYLLMSMLIPIVKDKFGDICSSENYRSIAISSLLLKIFDWVIIQLFSKTLELDQL